MVNNNDEMQMSALIFESKLGKLLKAFLRGLWNRAGYWKDGGQKPLKLNI